MSSPLAVSDVLDTVLARAQVWLTAAGHPLPQVIRHAWGPPAVDPEVCSLLVVYADALDPRAIGPSARVPGSLPVTRCAATPFLRVYVELWRCTPGPDAKGNPPPPAAEEDAALGLEADAWCLFAGLLHDTLTGSLVPGGSHDSVQLEALEVLEPEGGAAGFRIPLTLQLSDDGPPPVPS